MTTIIGPFVLSAAVIGGLLLAGKLILAGAYGLGLGVFRPYRGLAWPRGVQEDDDARFSWHARPEAAARRDDRRDPGVRPVRSVTQRAFDPAATPTFEDSAGAVDVEPLGRVNVHRARR